METLKKQVGLDLSILQEGMNGPVRPSRTLAYLLEDLAMNEPCLAADDREVLLLAVDFLLGEVKA